MSRKPNVSGNSPGGPHRELAARRPENSRRAPTLPRSLPRNGRSPCSFVLDLVASGAQLRWSGGDAKTYGIQTQAIHAGEAPDPVTRASAPNIAMSTTYVVSDANEQFSATALGDDAPFIYCCWGNPKSHPQHELAREQMRSFAGMLSFQVEDGRATAQRFADQLEVIHDAVSLGHHRSLIFHLPTDEMRKNSFQLNEARLARYREFAGDGIFRSSVGLEDADDLCAELERLL